MRIPLAAAIVLASAAALAAQDSVQREVKLPSGAVIKRTCATWRAEGVAIIPADARDPGGKAASYFTLLSQVIEGRLARVATDSTVLVASFAARVTTDGAVNGLRLIKGSGRAGFDMAARQAATFTPDDHDRLPMPAGMPDSLTVLISFGRRRDGSDFLVSHVRCPAMLLPDAPKPDYPVSATLTRSRYNVRVRYPVDTSGLVDTAQVVFVDQTPDAFGLATLAYLLKVRYLPEDLDGERRVAWIERTIVFVPPDQGNPETR